MGSAKVEFQHFSEAVESDHEDYDLEYASDDDLYDSADGMAADTDMAVQEGFDCITLTEEEAEDLLSQEVKTLASTIQAPLDAARHLLNICRWNQNDAAKLAFEVDRVVDGLVFDLDDSKTLQQPDTATSCLVCMGSESVQDHMMGLVCGHHYCRECWKMYCQGQIQNGVSTGLLCMASGCATIVPEEFVRSTCITEGLLKTYMKNCFYNYIERHHQMQLCPRENCDRIIRTQVPHAKSATCYQCKTSFCFQCRLEDHSPASCDTMERWLTEGADHREAIKNHKQLIAACSYMIEKTIKKCPGCKICIEKVGGCNRMHCTRCSLDFCWICLQDWKTHIGDCYNCNQYEASVKQLQSVADKARQELSEYPFHFQRWECHAASRELEEKAEGRVSRELEHRINGRASWIDWQFLRSAMACLKKCRHTLQYTYPYAYYLKGPGKQLFEYQQAKLEAEVENLAWSIEHVDLETHQEIRTRMYVAEKWRDVLLAEFSENAPASGKY